MKPNSNLRPIHILRYLYEHTDEEHPASTADIVAYLEESGIPTHRQTVAAEIEQLSELGTDIIATRSRQNQYFIRNRTFELAELKLMADAIQAAKFITPGKSEQLLRKLSKFTSQSHATELNRSLYRDERIKATNESVIYTVDLLRIAIQTEKIVGFKYYDYTPEKKKALRHHGQMYELSPYDLAWCNDKYYVFRYSKSHRFGEDHSFKSNDRKEKNILISAYLTIWAFAIIVFWFFTSGSDAMGYILMYLWVLLPATTFIFSFLIGKNDYWENGNGV